MTDRQERAHLRRTCELSFSRPGSGIVLDVHWRFAADYMAPAADSRGAFDRHVGGRLQGCPVRALAPDDLLLFLCLHGTFHLWDALGQISDVARLIESREDQIAGVRNIVQSAAHCVNLAAKINGGSGGNVARHVECRLPLSNIACARQRIGIVDVGDDVSRKSRV